MTFRAWRDGEFIPLLELLLAIGPWILNAEWRFRDCEFSPGWRDSDELNVMSNQGNRVSTRTLVDLVSDGIQMIDGEMTAYMDRQATPFLSIRSVRGDEWIVDSSVPDVTVALSRIYPEAKSEVSMLE